MGKEWEIHNLCDTNDKKKKKKKKTPNAVANKKKFIDSKWFIISSLLSLADNLAEGLQNSKCETSKSGLEYAAVKDIQTHWHSIDCNNNYEKEFDKGLTKDSKTHTAKIP